MKSLDIVVDIVVAQAIKLDNIVNLRETSNIQQLLQTMHLIIERLLYFHMVLDLLPRDLYHGDAH